MRAWCHVHYTESTLSNFFLWRLSLWLMDLYFTYFLWSNFSCFSTVGPNRSRYLTIPFCANLVNQAQAELELFLYVLRIVWPNDGKAAFVFFALILGSKTYRKRHMGNTGIDQPISKPCLGNWFLTNSKMVLIKLNTNSFTFYMYLKALINSKIYANKNAGVLVSPQGFFTNLTSRMSLTNQLHPTDQFLTNFFPHQILA